MIALFNWLTGPFWHMLFFRAEAARQATLLRTLAVAVEKQIALVPFLEALADEAGGKWRIRLRGLADLLNSGVSIPDALDAIAGLLPEDVLVMIRVGAESGRLGPALREAATQFARRSEVPRGPGGSTVVYLSALLFVALIVVGFVMYWVIPKFKAIFEGFNIELPELTLSVIHAANFAANYWYLLGPAIILGLLVGGGVGFELMNLGPGWSGTSTLLVRYFPRMKAPVLLRCLGLAVDGARPFHETLELLLMRHPSDSIRQRLAGVEAAIAQGCDCWESLHQAGLLRRGEVTLLASAERLGNLSWALRSVAETIERRADQRTRVALEFLRPATLLVAGGAVGFFVVGMFVPVVKVIIDLPVETVSR